MGTESSRVRPWSDPLSTAPGPPLLGSLGGDGFGRCSGRLDGCCEEAVAAYRSSRSSSMATAEATDRYRHWRHDKAIRTPFSDTGARLGRRRAPGCRFRRSRPGIWIKEGKGAIRWTRLSCRSFAANAVRLQLHELHSLAYSASPRLAI